MTLKAKIGNHVVERPNLDLIRNLRAQINTWRSKAGRDPSALWLSHDDIDAWRAQFDHPPPVAMLAFEGISIIEDSAKMRSDDVTPLPPPPAHPVAPAMRVKLSKGALMSMAVAFAPSIETNMQRWDPETVARKSVELAYAVAAEVERRFANVDPHKTDSIVFEVGK